ncbi:phosphonate ABC transporter, permease protein PhnE [Citricoccus sp.]|uniref:phosphonate ABC transporter, permease protein PhnE n=1 Tax=Citricoccus sp. TaxID=1978372 RepID=UPI0028BE004B|nr:phosphonate ABC transporter, permease protein PhnE [Citricoccus sp.]
MPTTLTPPDTRGRTPDPAPARPPRAPAATWVIPLILGAVTVFGLWWIDVRPAAIAAGFEDITRLLGRMFPATTGPVPELAALVLETLQIAIAGTGIAALVSIPLAAGAANTFTGPRWVQWLCRTLIVVSRAVPSLVFAIIFVRIFGLGPAAGALAIAFHSVGMIGKMMTDVFEEISAAPREAVNATGANRFQVFVATTFTQALPQMTSFVLYRLDINIRASSVLGLVGAGGIGVALQRSIGSLDYPRAAGIIAVIIVLLLVLELISNLVQRAVSEHAGDTEHSMAFPPGKDLATPGWNAPRVGRGAGLLAGVVLFLLSLSALSISPDRLARGWDNAVAMLTGFVPPVFTAEIALGLFESLVMAFTATTFGVLIGLVIAVFSTDHLVRVPVLGWALRGVIVVVRGVPDIVYAIVFVAALGLGPFAGFLALAISCTALASKFFTDALQNIDPSPIRALEAVGAGRLQAFVGGAWPQFVPSFIGNSLFTADLALRESAVLGIVGAGGIGFLLHESVTSIDYQTTAGILIGLIVVVVAVEQMARWARRKVI